MREIAIIGGGASGLFCGIFLKNQLLTKGIDDVAIVIYERLEKTGKKILVTGNGRCNYSNVNVTETKYNQPSFVKTALANLSAEELMNFYQSLGLYSLIDREGRIYPHSEVANTLLDVLRTKIRKYNMEERCNNEIKKIVIVNDVFSLETSRNTKSSANIVVLATGGKAAPIHGSNGSGYQLLKALRHKIVDPKPGLVGIKVDEASVKSLVGIRVKAKVNLIDKKKRQLVWSEEGEVLFKQDGLSGIVIMQLASQMMRKPSQYYVSLDLLPKKTWDDLFVEIKKRMNDLGEFENANILTGMFSKMLNISILKKAKIDVTSYIKDLSDREIARIVTTIKEFDFDVKGTYDFDKAQITVGGVDITEVNEETMESKKIPNLYIIGELLDVDGECGGYNLHWAFASAKLAAENILKTLQNSEQNDSN